MTGTPNQKDWAEQIKRRVNAEFDRVRVAFEQAARSQSEQGRMDTAAIIAILQQKRVEVMAKPEAGYFIREWQELRDQVRQMITDDPAYQTIKSNREARSPKTRGNQPTNEMVGVK